MQAMQDAECGGVEDAVGRPEQAWVGAARGPHARGRVTYLTQLRTRIESHEPGVTFGVITDREGAAELVAQAGRVGVELDPNDEERGRGVLALEDLHDLRRVRARPVVEGERHVAVARGSRGHDRRIAQRAIDRAILEPGEQALGRRPGRSRAAGTDRTPPPGRARVAGTGPRRGAGTGRHTGARRCPACAATRSVAAERSHGDRGEHQERRHGDQQRVTPSSPAPAIAEPPRALPPPYHFPAVIARPAGWPYPELPCARSPGSRSAD